VKPQPSGFDRLLARLDGDPGRAAAEFARLRRTLCKFFDWRGASSPDDAADDTLERLAGKLEEEVEVLDVPAFAHGIARLVLHEVQRREARHGSLEDLELAAREQVDGPVPEILLRNLRPCLDALPRDSRDLLLSYYAVGDGAEKIEGRRRLARKHGLSPNALRSRVQRLRDRVEACLRERHVSPGPLT
jgi:DNA-directed RNA polymerase specialized sigma24 family protein